MLSVFSHLSMKLLHTVVGIDRYYTSLLRYIATILSLYGIQKLYYVTNHVHFIHTTTTSCPAITLEQIHEWIQKPA